MAYYCQTNYLMPYERNLLMPFSVRHFAEDDKLCHHMSLEVLQDLFPREAVEQVRTSCHAWEKRERAAGGDFVHGVPEIPRRGTDRRRGQGIGNTI